MRLEKLTVPEAGSLSRYLHNYIDDPCPKTDKTIYLAESPQDIIGWTLIGLDEDFGMGDEGTIHLNVEPSMRGSGIGADLFNQALDEVVGMGFKKILTYGHDEKSTKFFSSKKIQDLCKSKNIIMEIIR
jgi:GNAT superfamily N-acetyltransferase